MSPSVAPVRRSGSIARRNARSRAAVRTQRGLISVKEYDFNMNLVRRVLEELVNTGFLATQMIVT